MIRQLRRRHRWMIGVVTVAVAVLFALAIAARPNWPVQESLPESPASETREDTR